MARALATAALAERIAFDIGQFVSGRCQSTLDVSNPTGGCLGMSLGSVFLAEFTGSLHRIQISASISSLVGCPDHLSGECYNILPAPPGLVTVIGSEVLFQRTLTGGFVHRHGDSFLIEATGPAGSVRGAFTVSTDDETTVTRGAMTFIAPEPGTLGKLGTGLIRLAAMARQIVFSLYCMYVKIMVADYD
jgi:hypothetical protein